MEQPTPSTKKNNTLKKDILIALIVVVSGLFALIAPPFFFASVLFCCALFCGGRKRFAVLLAAAVFALQAFIMGSFFIAVLFALAGCIMITPVALFRGKFSSRAHFDGVLASCAGVALMCAAVYGILYLSLGGEPIHLICEASHATFAADTSDLGTEMLRTLWQTKQVVLLSQTSAQIPFEEVFALTDKAAALTHEQLVTQTEGFIEFMTRTSLPALCVILTALGGLVLYVLPTHWMANHDRGMGKFLNLNKTARKLPAFPDWKLPRDIGNMLFVAVILLLVVSFMGFDGLNGAMSLVYTLFTAVFYVEGICFAAFMARRWKWNGFGRLAFSALAAVLVSPVSMIGTIDYIIRLREFMDFSKTIKDAAKTGDTGRIRHIFPGITVETIKKEDILKRVQQDKKENDETQDTSDGLEIDNNPDAEDAQDHKED